MATPIGKIHLSGLALRMVQQGFVEEQKASELQEKAAKKKSSFFAQAVRSSSVNNEQN